jgi:molybdopterin synthase sulfur carrier subunit
MPRVFIPPTLRPVTAGQSELEVPGGTVRQIVDSLNDSFPGVRERLCDADDLKPGLSVAIDGDISTLGLLAKVQPDSEIHFLPAIGGG